MTLKFFERMSKVGQRSRSRSCDQNLCYHQKGLVIKNPLVQYKNPMSNGKEIMCRVKVFQMQVKGHGQCHMLKIYSTIGKVWSLGTRMPNMKALSLRSNML